MSTATELQERKNGSLRQLAAELGFSASKTPTLSRILRGAPGVSLATENDIRRRLNLSPITRKPRKSRGFDADLIILFDMERDRQGLTNSEYLAALMGVSST